MYERNWVIDEINSYLFTWDVWIWNASCVLTPLMSTYTSHKIKSLSFSLRTNIKWRKIGVKLKNIQWEVSIEEINSKQLIKFECMIDID